MTDFDTLGYAPYPKCVGLEDIQAPLLNNLQKGEASVVMLPTCQRYPIDCLSDFDEAVNILWHEEFLNPFEAIGTEALCQADGVIHIKRHVAIQHDFIVVAYCLPRLRDEFLVLFQAPRAICGAVRARQFHRFEPELQLPIRIVASGVGEEFLAQRAAEEFVNRLVLNLAVQIPQCDINAAHRATREALRTVGF